MYNKFEFKIRNTKRVFKIFSIINYNFKGINYKHEKQ